MTKAYTTVPEAGPEGGPEKAAGDDQGSIFSGVARHSLIYGLGMVIGRAVSFIMLPIYTRYLTPADYGVMGLVEMTLDFVSIIAGAQLAAGVFRFYHKAESKLDRDRIVSTSFLIVAAMYSLVGTLAFFAAPLLSQLIFGTEVNTILFQVASVNLAMSALAIVPFSLARVQDRSVLYVTSNLIKLALLLGLNVLFLIILDMGVLGVFLSSLMANSVVGGALTIWLFRRVRPGFDPKSARALVRYGLPLMGMQLTTFAATFADRFFLQAFADETVVGLYNLAYQFGFLLVMVGFVPVDQIWGPRRFRAIKEPDRDDVLSRAFLMMNVLLFSVALGIVVLVEDVLRIMTTPAFHEAALVVPVILIAYVLQCWASIQDLGILVSERTEFLTLANVIAALVALGGYALLIPHYLAWGAALATVLSFATRFGLTYFFAQRLWYVKYRWKPVMILAGWTFGVSLASLFVVPELPLMQSVPLRIGIIGVFFGGLWMLPILEPRDRKAFLGLIQAIRTHLPAGRSP